MTNTWMKWKSEHGSWQDGATFILGLWLIVSPWIVGFADVTAAFWNAIVLGIAIAAFSLVAFAWYREWEDWIDGALGLWLVISPWALGFAAASYAAMVNAVVVGVIAMVLVGWSLYEHRHGGAATA
ncbi:MAG: hypothetical protein D6811_12230 [Alphaproteobacteria bacterium]|nr:MAG: hypothetical protein D6811_12230 [Alphaproteobacteria bacterium]